MLEGVKPMTEQVSSDRQRRLLSACAQQVNALTEVVRTLHQLEGQPEPAVEHVEERIVTPPLNQEQEAAVVALYEHGLSIRQIATKAKRSRMTIQRILQAQGVERRPKMERKLRPEQ